MLNLSIRQLNRTCLFIVVFVAAACGFLAVHDVTHKKRLLETEKSVLSSKIKEVDQAATVLNILNMNLADIKRELSELNERIPETGRIGLLLQQIDAVMKRNSLTLISLEPLPVTQDKTYLKNPIRLLFKGSFVNIVHLIRNLEEMNRIMVMENLSISKLENSGECQVELLTTVFERPKGT